jgi:hypothetical protein
MLTTSGSQRRAAWWLILTGTLLILGTPAQAVGTAPPATSAQAQAANAAFLAYAPPPPNPGAMCLVDTGVTPTPDTEPALTYATSLDGGTSSDTDPAGHGTLMATLAAGQGHGLRGIWPAIHIVSIRAASTPAPGQPPSYQYMNYVEALQRCLEHQALGVKTVNLSLSSTIPPTSDQAHAFAQIVDELVTRGVAIVAAAGNSPGKVQYPATEPGVLSVGAGTPSGGVCSFSATEGVDIFAPGCELDFADPLSDAYEAAEFAQGTSDASDVTDASLTALMSYDPQLTVAQAENLFVTTETSGHLNVAGAFEAAGLGQVVAAGNAAIPAQAPASASPPAPGPLTSPVLRPTIRSLSWKYGILTLRLRSLPSGEHVHLQVLGTHEKLRASSDKLTLSIHCARPRNALVWMSSGKISGPALRVRLASRHASRHPKPRAPRRHSAKKG